MHIYIYGIFSKGTCIIFNLGLFLDNIIMFVQKPYNTL